MALLQVNGISRKERDTYAVKDVSFTQESSQKIAIAGETGSGKTTLLKLIAGLVQPDSGEVLFHGKRVLGPLEKLLPGHPKIAYLSQHFELRNNYRVEEELEAKNLLSEEEANRIYSVCEVQHLLKRKTDQLSGGERQRIVLARLLTTSPELLLLDEPFSNLDAIHKSAIKSVLTDIGQQFGVTCMVVSHDAADTLSWADRIIIMKDGHILQAGSPEEIYREPVNEYSAGLFGDYNLIDADTYFKLSGKKIEQESIIIRPENIEISKEDKGVKGTVREVLFHGDHYVVEVMIGDKLILVKMKHKLFSIGEVVSAKIFFNT